MRFLILVNQAPNYYYFYEKLAYQLLEKNHKVFFAFNSHLPEVIYNSDSSKIPSFFFSEYFKQNFNKKQLDPKYAKYNLWDMFFSDFERYDIYDYHLKKCKKIYPQIIINLIHFFEEVITSHNIDAVIYEPFSNSFAYSAYIITQELQKKYYGICNSRISNRFEIITSKDDNKQKIEENYYSLEKRLVNSSSEIDLITKNYLRNFFETKPAYMINNKLSPDYNLFKKYISVDRIGFYCSLLKYRLSYSSDNKFNYQAPVFSINFALFKRNFKRKFRLNLVKKYFSNFDKSKAYYFYPIQYHPEASTSVRAKSYVNEYNNILNIATNIPFGKYLYVKEHESSVGNPVMDFYKRLSKIPNIVLLSHKYNAKEIIKNSIAVITITSTVGFEAIVLNKPIFVLGNVFYDFHPLCTKVKSFDSLFLLLKKQSNISTYDPSNFIKAYLMETFKGRLMYQKESSEYDNDTIEQIISFIEK